jgi:NAD+ kinase
MSMPALELSRDGRSLLGFNDITFSRRPHSRVAELAYSITGEEVGHVRCDGLVVSTPAGSTGYNLANHGPILAWGVAGYVVSYIAPHSLTARALVVAPQDTLTVKNAASRDPVEIAVDGRPVGELDIGAEVMLEFKPDSGLLAQLPGSSFYHRIREKFGHLAV